MRAERQAGTAQAKRNFSPLPSARAKHVDTLNFRKGNFLLSPRLENLSFIKAITFISTLYLYFNIDFQASDSDAAVCRHRKSRESVIITIPISVFGDI